uniref:Uncharacterized protein n=1 Tax=Micrurus corallinus TaxID=54390 RepID=A0A2D4EY07_MICCO
MHAPIAHTCAVMKQKKKNASASASLQFASHLRTPFSASASCIQPPHVPFLASAHSVFGRRGSEQAKKGHGEAKMGCHGARRGGNRRWQSLKPEKTHRQEANPTNDQLLVLIKLC